MFDLTSPLVFLPVLDLYTIVQNKVFSLLLHKLTWHFSPVIYFHIDEKYILDVDTQVNTDSMVSSPLTLMSVGLQY